MPIILDHQLREKIDHDVSAFPISYFQDELALLPTSAAAKPDDVFKLTWAVLRWMH